jgi:hypothetical protein
MTTEGARDQGDPQHPFVTERLKLPSWNAGLTLSHQKPKPLQRQVGRHAGWGGIVDCEL